MKSSNLKPSYLRARIIAIEDLIGNLNDMPGSKDRNLAILRNGVFPPEIEGDQLISKKLREISFSDNPLTFNELTVFNTWFTLHPEKVAGKEIITTSREFPISIKGTKQDIIQTIHLNQKNDFEFQLQLKRKTATAKLKLLKQ